MQVRGTIMKKSYELRTVKDLADVVTENNIDQSEGSGFAILAVPLGSTPDSSPRFGTLALAFSRYQGETNDIVKTTPDGHRRTVSYGITLENETSVGYSFTFYDDQLQSQLADLHSHARLLHVFGMKTPLDAITTLGATFEYGLGQSDTEDYRLGSDGLSHLKQYTGTVSVERQLGNVGDLFAFDVTRVSSEGNLTSVSAPVVVGGNEDGVLFNARAGIDAEVAERFFIRGGTRLYHTRYDFDRENLRSLSGTISGFGVSAGIDYTFPYSTDSPLRWNLSYGAEYLNVSDGASKQLTSLKITQNS